MSIFITQGRYTQQAMKGLVAKPEDRVDEVKALMKRSGGKLLNYYITFGEYAEPAGSYERASCSGGGRRSF